MDSECFPCLLNVCLTEGFSEDIFPIYISFFWGGGVFTWNLPDFGKRDTEVVSHLAWGCCPDTGRVIGACSDITEGCE